MIFSNKKNKTYLVLVLLSFNFLFLCETVSAESLPYQAATDEKGCLFIVKGGMLVKPTKPDIGPFKIYTHIPISYDNQTPITLLITDETGGKISGYRIMDNYPGHNALLEISFDNFETTDTVGFYWKAPVFLKYNEFIDLPENNEISDINSLPDEITPWLSSTEFIQADYPEIQNKALELADNRTQVLLIANDVADFTRNTVFTVREGEMDALTTLQTGGGNCVGKSNLAVAILRSLGIPARIVLEGPSPHYLAEFYIKPYGWVRLEATTGDCPWPYHANVITYCAFPEDENSTNYVNGINPIEGYVLYWGETNPEVLWGLNWETSYIRRHYLNTTKEGFNTALEISKEIWSEQKRCLELGLTKEGNEKYNQAITTQKEALDYFINGSYSNFLLTLEESYNMFLQIEQNATNTPLTIPEESSWISNSIQATIFISIFQICTISYFRRKRRKLN
jgi:transglutaminase-like putative cysteine protease